jgi:hypothetical protein
MSKREQSKNVHKQAPGANACNPSYLGSWDWEDRGSKPAQQKVCETPSQPIPGCSGVHLSSKAMQKAEIRESWFQASLGKKFVTPPPQWKKSWVWWCSHHSSNGKEHEIERIMIRASVGKKWDLVSKVTRAKGAGAWLKPQSACPTNSKPWVEVQNNELSKKLEELY